MIAGIVLAAGTSTRLGRPKQLLDVCGQPLLRHTIRRILASRLDKTVVVVGHEADAIRAAISDLPVTVVDNPGFAMGQSSSLRVGLSVLNLETEAAMFLLGDQPGVSSKVINALIAAWREAGAPIMAPRYTDGIGNPVLFDRRVFPRFATLDGDTGARPIVLAHMRAGELSTVSFDRAAPRDVDSEADYEALLASLPQESCSGR